MAASAFPAQSPPVPVPESTDRSRTGRLTTFQALRHRNYRLYFYGQIISQTGSWVQMAALTWLAYALTKQSRWAALVSAAQVIPTLFLGLWGGEVADRWPRRPVIFLCQLALLVLSLILAAMVALDAVTRGGLLTLALLIGVVNAIDTPVRLAFVVDMVGREDLLNAVALNSMIFNVARAIGPAICGWLLPLMGPGPCFLINGVTFLAVLAALLAMRLPPWPGLPARRDRRGLLWDGFAHLGKHPRLIGLVVLAGALAFFSWPMLALLPAVSDRQLDTGDQGYAWMLGAVGAGALLGALTVATFGTVARRNLFLVSGLSLSATALVGLAFASTLPLAVLASGISGGGLILFFATGQATLQLGADDHNRGRVMAIWLVVLSGAQPVGNLVAGYLADRWGVSTVLLAQAAGVILAAILLLPFALTRPWPTHR